MSIDDIKEKIFSDAEGECERIKKSTAQIIKEAEVDFGKRKKVLIESYKEKLQRQLEDSRERTLSLVKQRLMLERESLLRKEVDSIFKEHYDQLVSIDSQKYTDLITKFITSTVPTNFQGICLAPAKRIKETQKALLKAGLSDVKEIEEDKGNSLQGGLILENEDDYYDLSFETLISLIRDENEDRINQIIASKS